MMNPRKFNDKWHLKYRHKLRNIIEYTNKAPFEFKSDSDAFSMAVELSGYLRERDLLFKKAFSILQMIHHFKRFLADKPAQNYLYWDVKFDYEEECFHLIGGINATYHNEERIEYGLSFSDFFNFSEWFEGKKKELAVLEERADNHNTAQQLRDKCRKEEAEYEEYLRLKQKFGS